ncbi:MAG: MMPL family transporter [Pirellulaceae bacterium]|nr:MMPL family transporter [Pirellulaceae bacterium]
MAFYALGLIVCVLGYLHFESNMEDVFQWLPDETPDRELYNHFVDSFGVDDFLVVTWPDCTITDKRADEFSTSLIANDKDDLIEQAVSGRQLVRRLITQWRQSPTDVIERFSGIYFGPDGRSTCVVVMLTQRGMNDRVTMIGLVKQTAKEAIGVSEDDLVLAGYPQMGAYGDAVVRSSIRDFVGPSCVISTIVAWICLRHFGLTIIILAVGGLAAGLSVSIVTLSGAKWGGLSSVIPSLAYILSVSGALHLVNYSRTRSEDPLLTRILRIGWKPCLLSALTTAAGMLSLCRSNFSAIREFGLFCAAGVLASLACQLFLIPIAIDWLNPKNVTPVDRHTRSPFLDRLLPWSNYIALSFIAATLVTGLGLLYLRSDLEVERNFSSAAPVMQDIGWLETHIGPVEQTELLVTFDNVSAAGFHERLSIIRDVQAAVESSPHVSTALSIAAWLPEEPQGTSLRMTAARSAYRKLIQQARRDQASKSYLLVNDDAETWRISVRFPFLEPTDFKGIKHELPKLAIATINGTVPGADISVQHTGVSLLYHVAQDELVDDLYRNFAFAFVMICPLMMLVLRSIKQGALAMIPNVCPAVVAYGLIGWLDYPIDIGMAMTACVALGIAVDDTTHFMLRFQDLRRDVDLKPLQALRITFHQCSRAMFHTTLITGLGLSAFLFSPLSAMTRFASLLILLITIALACDLVLLPALLKTFRFARDEARDIVPQSDDQRHAQ